MLENIKMKHDDEIKLFKMELLEEKKKTEDAKEVIKLHELDKNSFDVNFKNKLERGGKT